MITLVIGGHSGIGLAVRRRLLFESGDVLVPPSDELDVRWTKVNMLNWLQGTKHDPMRINQLVYCAGINYLEKVSDIQSTKFKEILQVNTVGFVTLVGSLLNLRVPLKSVVAVSSDAANRPMRGSTMYCASKAALDASVRCMARELAPKVRVNAVAPGMTEGTLMTTYIDQTVPKFRGWTPEQARQYEESQIPMGRRATPDEVAEVVVSTLKGPDYMTGAIIPINGGR